MICPSNDLPLDNLRSNDLPLDNLPSDDLRSRHLADIYLPPEGVPLYVLAKMKVVLLAWISTREKFIRIRLGFFLGCFLELLVDAPLVTVWVS